MDTYIKLIDCFADESKFYWINALVKQNKISKALAGWYIIYFNL